MGVDGLAFGYAITSLEVVVTGFIFGLLSKNSLMHFISMELNYTQPGCAHSRMAFNTTSVGLAVTFG